MVKRLHASSKNRFIGSFQIAITSAFGPHREEVDSHKTIECWRKYPEYRDDVRLCWYGRNLEKNSAKAQEEIQRGDVDSETS